MKNCCSLMTKGLATFYSLKLHMRMKFHFTWHISTCFINSWFLFSRSSTIEAFAKAIWTLFSASSNAASFDFVRRSNALLSFCRFAICRQDIAGYQVMTIEIMSSYTPLHEFLVNYKSNKFIKKCSRSHLARSASRSLSSHYHHKSPYL